MVLLVGLRDRGKVPLEGLKAQGRADMGRIAAGGILGRLGQVLQSRLPLLEPAALRAIGREPFAFENVSISLKTLIQNTCR